MDTLKTISEEMAQLVQLAGRSVVRVEGRRRMAASGVLLDATGHIVATHHTVQRDEGVRVGLAGGHTVSAHIVGRDPSTDIVLLKVDATDLPAANWQPAANASVGHMVLALGRPGDDVQATLGVVSALGDGWRAPSGGMMDRYLQTDVTMYPGFSGGPLVSADGAVLGLNTSAVMRGISLTIPTETVRRVASALAQHGHIKRGYLGVTAQAVRLPEGLAAQVGQDTGLMVAAVEPGSPADAARVFMGDVILAMAGERTRSMDDLMGALSTDRVGQAVPMRVFRAGEVQELHVTVGERA